MTPLTALRLLVTIFIFFLASASAQTSAPASNDEIKPSAPLKTGAVTPPRVLYQAEPEYSERARKAKLQGACELVVVVGTDGIPHDIKVARSLAPDLDQQAIKAMKQWKFEPARKDGAPVEVQLNVEVTFRLYPEMATNPEIMALSQKALKGDLEAVTNLGLAYLNGGGTEADSARGLKLLEYAAQHGSPHAQFELAQRIVKSPEQSDYVSAYSWYAIAKRGGHKVDDQLFRELESKMTPDQVTAAKARIDAWHSPTAK